MGSETGHPKNPKLRRIILRNFPDFGTRVSEPVFYVNPYVFHHNFGPCLPESYRNSVFRMPCEATGVKRICAFGSYDPQECIRGLRSA